MIGNEGVARVVSDLMLECSEKGLQNTSPSHFTTFGSSVRQFRSAQRQVGNVRSRREADMAG